ncbi:MAG: hypothetical protein JEY79_18015 [Pseudodesulfovibrio sp.]|nr:hypothetical protein [Pseudodesulfovibrio sp.]
MASKSTRNTIAVLSLCHAVGIQLETYYNPRARNKTGLKIASRIHEAANRALQDWPERLQVRDIVRLHQFVDRFASVHLTGKFGVTAHTSTCLALLEPIIDATTNPEKTELLGKVYRAVTAAHKYLDRNGEFDGDYEKANAIVEAWEWMEK